MRAALLVTSFLALGSAAFAQSEDRAPASGTPNAMPVSAPQMALGSVLQGPIDVQTPITLPPAPGPVWTRLLGAARAWNYLWVSGGAGTAGAFAIHQYDLNGVYIQSFIQDMTQATASQWGVRDFAVDHANFRLWAGMEGRVMKLYTFNPNAGPNGTLSYTNTYILPTGGTFLSTQTVRALALDNSGTFYVKNFNTAMWKFTFNGTAFTYTGEYAGNAGASYGIAYDSFNDTLWQFDQNASAGTGSGTNDLVVFKEVNKSTGTLTGRQFDGNLTGTASSNLAGGVEFFNDGSGVTKLCALHQDTPDSVYIYELDVTVSPPVNYCTAGTTTNNCVAAISASAQPSVTAATACNISVTNVEGQKSGLIFYSITGQAAAPWNATSFLCVKAPTQRTGTQTSGGTASACDGTLSLDWNAFQAANPSALGNPWSAGNLVQVQAWFRDPPAGKATNLSNGVELTYQP
jgi:hypothetical protein